MKALNLVVQFLLFVLLFSLHKAVAEGVTPEEAKQLRDEVKKDLFLFNLSFEFWVFALEIDIIGILCIEFLT